MFPRVEYEMTEEDLNSLLEASKPTICMKIGSYTGSSPQENANRAWERLGEKMGFDYLTVRPINGKGNRFFTAVPTENAIQREERLKRETREKRDKDILNLQTEIAALQEKLSSLEKESGQSAKD